MKRSTIWVASIGVGWALLGSALAYQVAVLVGNGTSDFYLQNETLNSLLWAFLSSVDARLAGAVLAAVLCFVCVALFKAPSRVWLGVLFGVLLASVLQLAWIAYVALAFGGVFSGGSLDTFLREDLVSGLIAVATAWVGASLATRWPAFRERLRSVDDDKTQVEAQSSEPFVPDDWDEAFDTRASDGRA